MTIKNLSPTSPSAFINRRVWDEVVMETNDRIYLQVLSEQAASLLLLNRCLSASYPCIPFSIIKGEKGIPGNDYNSLSSCPDNYLSHITGKYNSFFFKAK